MAASFATLGSAVNRVSRWIVVRAVRLVTEYGGRGDSDGDPVKRPRGAGAKVARSTVLSMSSSSVVGIMNEFSYLAEAYRDHHPGQDLLGLAMRPATTPCGPLYTKNISPDRELAAFLHSIAP